MESTHSQNTAFSGGGTQAWQILFAGFVHKLNVVCLLDSSVLIRAYNFSLCPFP